MGRGSTVDCDFWGSIVALPSGPGGAQAENENDFGACCRLPEKPPSVNKIILNVAKCGVIGLLY